MILMSGMEIIAILVACGGQLENDVLRLAFFKKDCLDIQIKRVL